MNAIQEDLAMTYDNEELLGQGVEDPKSEEKIIRKLNDAMAEHDSEDDYDED